MTPSATFTILQHGLLERERLYQYYPNSVASAFLIITLETPYTWEREKRLYQLDFLYVLWMEHKTRVLASKI